MFGLWSVLSYIYKNDKIKCLSYIVLNKCYTKSCVWWPWWKHIKSGDVGNIVKWYGIIDKVAFWDSKIE